MKRIVICCIAALCCCMTYAQGIPFLHNFRSNDYHAHNRNFDVVTDQNGTVYFANFEGLLYYNNVEWRILHNPGITRITVLFIDKHNVVWAGGYNFFGRIAKKSNGELSLQSISKANDFHGEVLEIWENADGVGFLVNDGNIYHAAEDKVEFKMAAKNYNRAYGLSDIVQREALAERGEVVELNDVTLSEPLDYGLKAVVKKGNGLSIINNYGRELYTITEANGLSTNNVTWVSYNGHGTLWGATENGVFSMAVPSVITNFTAHEGLDGEVLSIEEFDGKMYVGTNSALYRLENMEFKQVPGIRHSCWMLMRSGQNLLAATANGIYLISANNTITQLTTKNTMALLEDKPYIYSGEIDGVYQYDNSNRSRKTICKLGYVNKIVKDGEGTIWLQNTYGKVWCKTASEKDFHPYKKGTTDDASALVVIGPRVEVVSAVATTPFPYPLMSYYDNTGVTWLTNNEGKGLYRWKDGKRLHDMDQLLFPVHEEAISTMYVRNGELWLGSDDGLTIINTHWKDPLLEVQPKLVIRSVVLGGDSVLWGGYGEMPEKLENLQHNEDDLAFTYSLNYTSVVGKTLYRYKMDNEKWSPWSTNTRANFTNIPYHTHTFSVQAMDVMGRQSDVVSIQFYITPPFYRQWYMYLLYFIITAVIIYAFVQLRLRKLQNDKIQLEHVIQERTAEVVKQKDEIEEKSKSLETALRDLEEAQHELIRQEKMATAGKLTQGLIDRILNPMNYINNFSKLSCGLLKDLKANIEDEEEHMDKENYEDTLDVLDMLDQNLQKVEQHGLNTTRTLKAMEEILKDRTGGKISMDLCSILKQDEEMLHNYFKEKISTYHIQVLFSLPETSVTINGNPELLSMTFMSILGNSMYALEKKAARVQYTPEISVTLKQVDTNVIITIRDTGIGIESSIIDKIFDPFFTTKPTGEAAGIGLYLSHEVIQNHNGSIGVESEKDNYTTITITLPILQN